MNAKGNIYITQKDNDDHFGQNLSTYRDGFCWIKRTVRDIEQDTEFGGFTGTLNYGGQTIHVHTIDTDLDGAAWDID